MTFILIVDDNPDDREFIQRELTRSAELAPDCAEAADETSCLQALAQGQRRPDCIVLDYSLPGRDGLAVLRRILEEDPLACVVMVTGQGNEKIATEAMQLGAQDYLVKNAYEPASIVKTVINAIQRSEMARRIAHQQEALATFAHVLAHDLKAPLRHIDSLGEEALEEAEDGNTEGMLEALRDQRGVVSRARALISTLETYALLGGEVPRDVVGLAEIARDARSNLEDYLKDRNATVEIGALPDARVNAAQMTQVMQNLIQNGIKYNEAAAPQIRVSSQDAGDGAVLIVIEDNGIGIPDDKIDLIFEPLKRLWTYEEYDGHGLGLSICKRMIEANRGSIWCQSTPGQGSQFFLKLPRADAEAADDQDSPSEKVKAAAQ